MRNLLIIFSFGLLLSFAFINCDKDEDPPVNNNGDNEPEDTISAKTPVFPLIEDSIYILVNEYRDSLGLDSLIHSNFMKKEARIHSRNMAAGIVPYGHSGSSTRYSKIRDELGWGTCGENVNEGFFNSLDCFNSWVASYQHKANIEFDFTHTGIGVSQDTITGNYYFTQIFFQAP